MPITKGIELLVNNEKVKVDNVFPYAWDIQYFAVIGKDLYHREQQGKDNYILLKKDYLEVK
jgi:hypothetical protein